MSNIVDLDVGGTRFVASRSTLSKSPFLEAMLRNRESGTIGSTTTTSGAIFIDRSPAVFPAVLEYLRTGKALVSSELERVRLQDELSFFGFDVEPPSEATSNHPVDGAVVSARWNSREEEELVMHVEGPPAVLKCIKEKIDSFHLLEEYSGEFEGQNRRVLQMSCTLEDPRFIPLCISDIVAALRKLGFAEASRSESSSVAKEHWTAEITGGLFPRSMDWRPPTWKQEEGPYEPEPRLSHFHWVSETVSLTRSTSGALAQPIRLVVKTPSAQRSGDLVNDLECSSIHVPTRPGQSSGNSLPSGGTSPALSQANATAQETRGTVEKDKLDVSLPSDEEALLKENKENADLSKALMESKADVRNSDRVLVLRLTSNSDEVRQMLTENDHLSTCRDRVHAAGCELCPAWANGAVLLVPLLPEQLFEAGLVLKAHNIVALEEDKTRIEDALASLPRRKRPHCKPEYQAEIEGSGQGHVELSAQTPPDHGSSTRTCDQMGADMCWTYSISIEHTFITCSRDADDESSLVQSAPCGNAEDPQPRNPRCEIVLGDE